VGGSPEEDACKGSVRHLDPILKLADTFHVLEKPPYHPAAKRVCIPES
jgi:hypothetical protein